MTSGAFVRQASKFRGRDVEPVAGRYHLYVSLACPWAHRTVIVRRLKGLEHAIGMTVVDPIRDDRGWRFGRFHPDLVNGWSYLSEAYEATEPGFDGRISVPVLWDTRAGGIVNNESADVIEMLNRDFDAVARRPDVDFYPEDLRDEIDALNAWVYEDVNNGVYKAGFASSQEAYEDAVGPLFEGLDRLEERLQERRYLTGDRITLADWRLFTTLVRFDAVYVGHFKCNVRRIADYANMSGYLRDLYQAPGVAETVDLDQIKRHYYLTHPSLNPSRVVPFGPVQDFSTPHGRA